MSEDRLRAAVGADHYMGSLREGVNTCLDLARSAQPVSASRTLQSRPGMIADPAPT